MTETPASPLPGLPQAEPEPSRELTDLEVCSLNLMAAVVELCGSALRENPGLNPADAAGNIGGIVGKALATLMPPQAARLGILVAFEGLHEEPMNFISINHAKEALTKLADRRRRLERTTASGLIIPGKD